MIFWLWAILAIRKGKFSWHTIVAIYVFAEAIVDLAEVLSNQLLHLYEFSTHLFSDPVRSDRIGIMLADVIILPASSIIFCYYTNPKKPWLSVGIFTFIHITLELVYLKLDLLRYHQWNILFSTLLYLVGFRFLAYFSKRFVEYNPPVPYWVRLYSFTYTALVLPGAVFSGVLINWHQWRPNFLSNPVADDRLADIGLCVIISLMTAFIIPKVSSRYRMMAFVLLTLASTIFALYSHWRGWLIYHYWNHLLTILRYFLPFSLVIWYDRWESGYVLNKKK
ncbi:hypothetical protein [Ammoniphilus sp. 3BR4]|uniref:hypothetical protein n=1 Tax=Ammoniphilus sp. 3BR4 TaxID=3158265 RepID=UPI00346649E1